MIVVSSKIFCTVMTPTYNRGHLLKRLYDSLVNQTNKDFEWIIVDDGSIDNTQEIVNEFIKDKKSFPIKYFYQKNGGKHRAVNNGIVHASGKVFAIVDSDDYLTKDAIAKIRVCFDEVEHLTGDRKFGGIAMLKGYDTTHITGKTFKGYYVDAKSTERRKYNIDGDKFEVFYTSILKENKFPEINGENFMTEAILWNRIAHIGYYLRWYNDIIYICEYLPNGLSDAREKLIEKNPKGYAMYIKELVSFGNITIKQKIGYYSFYTKIRKSHVDYKTISQELETNVLMIRIAAYLRNIKEKSCKHEKK